jgi:hypothetical protein
LKKRIWKVCRVLAGLCAVSAVLALAFLIPHIRNTTVCFALILTILGLAVKWGRAEAVASSVFSALGFAYYFQPPIGSFAISPEGWVATGSFLITAIWVSHLSLRAKTGEREAIARRLETERLYELGQSLLGVDRLETVAWTVINRMAPIFGVKGAAFCFVATGEVHMADKENCAIADDQLIECARKQAVFRDTGRDVYIIPLQCSGEPVGSLGVCGIPFSETVLKSVGHLVAVVLERALAAEALAKTKRELVRQNEVVEKERKTSEALLLNILPAEVAHELRRSGMVAPKYFEDVTIVFTDFVGFTLSTEKLAAEELVTNLHEYFTAFDKICARYQLEKRKPLATPTCAWRPSGAESSPSGECCHGGSGDDPGSQKVGPAGELTQMENAGGSPHGSGDCRRGRDQQVRFRYLGRHRQFQRAYGIERRAEPAEHLRANLLPRQRFLRL